MTNAAEELISLLKATNQTSGIKAAIVYKQKNVWNLGKHSVEEQEAVLPENYDVQQHDHFFDLLSLINYDDGYGTQELFGIIWFKDGSWATRGEYDGSEWWEHHKCPDIEEHFRIFENRHGEPKDPSYE